jgi:DNA-directed RNA polymerase specialized sigma24 family protein
MPVNLRVKEAIDQLPEALKELEDMDRHLICAFYLENKSYSEVSSQFAEIEVVVRRNLQKAVAKLERLLRLISAMKRKNMPAHYRRLICATRFRGWTVARISRELGLNETGAQRLVNYAEEWMQLPANTI